MKVIRLDDRVGAQEEGAFEGYGAGDRPDEDGGWYVVDFIGLCVKFIVLVNSAGCSKDFLRNLEEGRVPLGN